MTVSALPENGDVKQEPGVTNATSQKLSELCDENFVRTSVNDAVAETIGEASYMHDTTTMWTNSIVENLVRKFVNIDRENKYIVSCMIVQKSDAGMRSATSCFWNAQTDSGHSVT